MQYYERLRAIREDKDLSQKQCADAIKTSQRVYSRYETGINEMTVNRLAEICKYLNVSADYILGLPKDMPYPETKIIIK